jgi:hypothetical protein
MPCVVLGSSRDHEAGDTDVDVKSQSKGHPTGINTVPAEP